MIKKNIDYNTVIKFSKGKYSYNDYLKVKEWFNKSEKSGAIKTQLFDQWKELTERNNDNDDSLQHIFEKIQYNILLEEKKNSFKKVIWNFYRHAAAILLIPALAFSLWYYISSKPPQPSNQQQLTAQSWVEINAPDGARVQFMLPASS
ncbi:MAG: hypothetical protein L3J54_09180, partial [Draconibacterium sp.]|nr:hypothetical protein [Draconibacterium sp.]